MKNPLRKEDKEVKKIGVGWLGNAFLFLIGVFFIAFSVLAITESIYASGILGILIGLFLVLPVNTLLKKFANIELTNTIKFLITVGAGFLWLIVLGTEVGGWAVEAVSPLLGTQGLGEEFIVQGSNTNFSFNVQNAEFSEEPIFIGGSERLASGVYYMINCSVKNLGVEPFAFDYHFFLTDSLNRTFSPFGASGFDSLLQPDLPTGALVIFDVPKNITGLKLLVHDFNSFGKLNTYNKVNLE